MNSRDLISQRRGRAVAIALVAIFAFSSLGGAIFAVAQAGAMIAEDSCTEYDDSWVECEETGGGGGDGGGIGGGGITDGGGYGESGGWDEGGWDEGGGLTPEEEESIEIETGGGGVEIEMGGDEGDQEESGGLTPEEEESIEIESGDDGKTPQEREEAAEERMKEDQEFEEEWEAEIKEEEAEKAQVQRKHEVIDGLRKEHEDEPRWSSTEADCQSAQAQLKRDQRRGSSGVGRERLEVQQCFSEVAAASIGAHCDELDEARESQLRPDHPTTSVDEDLVTCFNDLGLYRHDAQVRAQRVREMQERGKGKKPHRTRHHR